jgi:hypothetical protein
MYKSTPYWLIDLGTSRFCVLRCTFSQANGLRLKWQVRDPVGHPQGYLAAIAGYAWTVAATQFIRSTDSNHPLFRTRDGSQLLAIQAD